MLLSQAVHTLPERLARLICGWALAWWRIVYLGAVVLVVLPQALTVFHEYEQALLGLIVMVFMIFLRRGIVPSIVAALAGRRK